MTERHQWISDLRAAATQTAGYAKSPPLSPDVQLGLDAAIKVRGEALQREIGHMPAPMSNHR